MAACALLAAPRQAGAANALVGAATATELRVAYAETAQWTTVWASFRLDGDAGPFGVIVPLPDGAFVDQSSDAWFEALEVATAPRVRPPDGLSPYCPGSSGPDDPFEITASTAHAESLLPVSIALLDGAAGVAGWAAAEGLSVDAGLADALAATGAAKLMGVRFDAPGGPASTPTLRVTAPKGLAALPFSVTRAGAGDVRVTAWLLDQGRATFAGATLVNVPGSALAWDAKTGRSNYVEYRDGLLSGDPDGDALESAGHDALNGGVAAGAVTLDGVAPVYFQRASAYGNGLPGAQACIDAATAALESDMVVGPACPRGDLAALAGACAGEPPGNGEADPKALLCGPGADDLALAVTGAVPADTWVTRHTFVIAAGSAGKDRKVAPAAAPEKVPVVTAASVDIGGCFGGAGGGATTSSTGSGTGTTTSSTSSSGSGGASTGSGTGNSGPGSTGSGNPGVGGFGGFGGYAGEDSGSDVYIDTSGCSCGPTVVDTYDTDTAPSGGDDCDSGSSSSSASGDDCDSGSSSAASGEDCDSGSSSAASGEDCDSGSSSTGDSCSSDSSGASSCSGDSASSDCSVGQGAAKGRRRAGPRLSVVLVGLVALLFPLRRRGTRQRRKREDD